jgi:hypothetical protein
MIQPTLDDVSVFLFKSFHEGSHESLVRKGIKDSVQRREKLEKSFKKPRWCAAAADCAKP